MPDSPESEPIDAEIVREPTPRLPAAPIPDPPSLTPGYNDAGVPSFDYVRDKIEGRFTTSIGGAELAGEDPEGRSIDQQEADRAKLAAERLAEIRRTIGR